MNCPVCKRSKKLSKQISPVYFQCFSCHSIYQYPIPDINTIKAYYESYKKIKFKMNPGYLSEKNFSQYKQIMEINFADLQINKSFFFKKKILDVGCANGDFLLFLKEKNIQGSGIDISHDLVKNAQERGLDVKAERLENVQKKFEIVTCWDVIEHIPYPVEFICNLERILLDGGFLLLSTPVVGLVTKFFGKNWRFLMPDEHLFLFTKKCLFQVLENNGFKILKLIRFGSGFTSGMIINPLRQFFNACAKKLQFGDRIVVLCHKSG